MFCKKTKVVYKKTKDTLTLIIFVSLVVASLSGFYKLSHPTEHLKAEDFFRPCNETKCEVVFIAGNIFAKFANETDAKFYELLLPEYKIEILLPDEIKSTIKSNVYTTILNCEKTRSQEPSVVCRNDKLDQYYNLSAISHAIFVVSFMYFIMTILICISLYCQLKPIKVGDSIEYV